MTSLDTVFAWIAGPYLAATACGGSVSTGPGPDASDSVAMGVSSDAPSVQEASGGDVTILDGSAADTTIPAYGAVASLGCQGAADCPNHQVCCAAVDQNTSEVVAACAANCPDTGGGPKALAQACYGDSECQNGKSCVAQTCLGHDLDLCGLIDVSPFHCQVR